MFWCLSLRLCQPGLKTRNRAGIWKWGQTFFFFVISQCAGKRGQLCSSRKNVAHEEFTVSAEMELALLSLLGSKWVECLLFFSCFLHICTLLRRLLREPQFTSIPSQLLLCHTVLALGATPKPRTCSRYCRLFTWHRLNHACILTPALTACAGVGRVFFRLRYFNCT